MDVAGSDHERFVAPVMLTEAYEQDLLNGRKRPPENDAIGGKKRRKQLKPVRIATNPDSLPSHMVQVPKDDLVSCSESSSAVPQLAKPPRCPLKDVAFQNELLSDATMAVNVPTPLDSGPSLSAYPFPFSYQPHGRWTDRSLKIFNQEAYCELCKKEFCNKYFLKTHKANKHGIYNNESNCSSVTRVNVDSIKVVSGPEENGNSQHDYDIDDKTKAFCDLCNKSFCNKYFVRRHKSKSHGLDIPEGETTLVQKHSTNDARSTLTLGECQDEDSYYPVDEKEEPLNLIVNAESESSSECKPGDCTENLEKLETMLMRLHPNASEIDQQTDESCDAEPQSFKIEPELPIQCLSRKQSKPASSYCEICNKELCNKYFMRTHMQRMHGIELEHGTQIGGVVCNICNKELCSKYFLRVHKQNTHGVPGQSGLPNIHPEVKTPPRPNSFSQVCVICSKRFRSSKWLQAHMQSDHRDDPRYQDLEEPTSSGPVEAPLNVISKLLWETNSMSSMFSCSQCAFSTPVLAFLFVHERSHFLTAEEGSEAVKPSLALQDLIHNKTFWQHAITQQPCEGLDLSARVPSSSHS